MCVREEQIVVLHGVRVTSLTCYLHLQSSENSKQPAISRQFDSKMSLLKGKSAHSVSKTKMDNNITWEELIRSETSPGQYQSLNYNYTGVWGGGETSACWWNHWKAHSRVLSSGEVHTLGHRISSQRLQCQCNATGKTKQWHVDLNAN